MICRRATYFTDLEMIEYFQKTCGWNSQSPKTATNYARYTTLKNLVIWFTLGHMTVTRISKQNSDLQLAY